MMEDTTPRPFLRAPFPVPSEDFLQSWLAERFEAGGWTVHREAAFLLQSKGKRRRRQMDLYASPPATHPDRMRIGAVAIELKRDRHTAHVLTAGEQAGECLTGMRYHGTEKRPLVRPNLAFVACDASLGFAPETKALLLFERMLWRMPGEVGLLRFDHASGRCWFHRGDDGENVFDGLTLFRESR